MLQLGSQGPLVLELQQLLNKHNRESLKLKEDQRFGPLTQEALRQFQKRVMLPVTGMADDKTLGALRGTIAPPAQVPSPVPGNDPLGLLLDYPPFATVLKDKMKERGLYPKKFPFGIVLHYTAGWDGAIKTIMGGIKGGLTFWCTQRDGKLYCAHRVQYHGYHAGKSGWIEAAKKLVGSVSDDLLGIEHNAFGSVKPVKDKPGQYVTYFGHVIGDDEVRYSPGRANQGKGYYHVLTTEQIETFIKVAMWCKLKSPAIFDFDHVLGHDEVAGPSSGIMKVFRKTDPGASIPWTMPQLREGLKKYYVYVASKPGFKFESVSMTVFSKYIS